MEIDGNRVDFQQKSYEMIRKRPLEDAERRACVVISTYSMLGFTGRRGGDTATLGWPY